MRLPGDLTVYSIPELDAILDALRRERAAIDLKLAGMVGSQYEAERAIEYRKRERIDEDSARVKNELRNRRETEYEAQIKAIRAKYAEKVAEIEGRRDAERMQTIRRFEQTLADNPNSELAPDILYRLAALYLEIEHEAFLNRMEEYDVKVDELMRSNPDVEVEQPKKSYDESIRIYRRIVTEYPDYHHIDGALYNLAFTLGETGEYVEANEMFAQLIELKPDSPFVPEAYVRMGEFYFDMENFEAAIERYEHVLQYKDSSFYDKALYKLGWSYYRLDRLDEAKAYFSQVIDFAESDSRRTRRGDDLRTEAITYIAISFADDERYEFEGAERAFLDYMTRHGDRPWKAEVVAAIGEVYFERANFTGARGAFNTVVQMEPLDPRNPEMVKRIIESYEREQSYDMAIEEGERLARLFGPGTDWRKANADDPRVIASADDLIQSALFASATFHHENAQLAGETERTVRQREYARAIMSYRYYLESYPEAANAYEARFNLAESLYFSNRFKEAADVYATLLEYPKGEQYKYSAGSLIKSLDEQLRVEGGLDKSAAKDADGKTTLIPPRELSPTAQGLVNACLLHVKLFPEDKASNALYLARAGEVYYYHGQYADARAVFDRLVFGPYEDTEEARVAANLTIESLKAQEMIPELEDYARRIRTKPIVSKQDVREIDSLIQDAAFVNAQRMADAGQFPEAVAEFLRAAYEHPKLANAPKAMHNAAFIYEAKLNNIYKANEIYIETARKYPKWDGSSKDMFHAATNYEKVVEIEQAMAIYEEFGTMFPKDPEAPNALFNAGLLREKNKEYSKAIAIYKRHLTQYPNSRDAGWLTFQIGKLYGEMNRANDQEAWLLKYVRGYSEPEKLVEAYCTLGNIARERGKSTDAGKHYQRAIAIYQKAKQSDPELSSEFAAEAWFYSVEPTYEHYTAIHFTLPQSRMAKQLKEKAKVWKELTGDYQKIIVLGNFEWATASLYRLGEINKMFSEELFNAPIPDGLTPEQEDMYVVSLEDRALPIQDRAIEAYTTNIEKAASFRFRKRVDRRLLRRPARHAASDR